MEGRHGVRNNMFHVCFGWVWDFWNFGVGFLGESGRARYFVKIAEDADFAEWRGEEGSVAFIFVAQPFEFAWFRHKLESLCYKERMARGGELSESRISRSDAEKRGVLRIRLLSEPGFSGLEDDQDKRRQRSGRDAVCGCCVVAALSESRMTRITRRDAEGRVFLCMYTSVISEILDREGGTLLDLIRRALHQYKN